jgi:riboflavin kinase/FMN adenylyltransferase
MEVFTTSGPRPPSADGCVVTIGAYDGVHLGHRHLIGQLRNMAAELGGASAVVTFDRHPARVVRPDSAPKLLTDLEQKLELLAETGVDYTLVVHFDKARSEETAEEFVTEVLVGCLGAQAVVVGHDFHFGHRRQGNVALLQRMGADYGFDVHGLRLVSDGQSGEPVSSTRIRELLAAGEVAAAAGLLGRPHEVRGVVRPAASAGLPVDVQVPPEICQPADGIYDGQYVRPDGSLYEARLSVGPGRLQAHLLGFEGDLSGEPARVRFLQPAAPG